VSSKAIPVYPEDGIDDGLAIAKEGHGHGGMCHMTVEVGG